MAERIRRHGNFCEYVPLALLLLAMAERCSANVAAHLSAALDTHTVQLQRDGLGTTEPARFGLVALDEGNDDERLPATLLDRLAFQLALAPATDPDGVPQWTPQDIADARQSLQALWAVAPTLERESLLAIRYDDQNVPAMRLMAMARKGSISTVMSKRRPI